MHKVPEWWSGFRRPYYPLFMSDRYRPIQVLVHTYINAIIRKYLCQFSMRAARLPQMGFSLCECCVSDCQFHSATHTHSTHKVVRAISFNIRLFFYDNVILSIAFMLVSVCVCGSRLPSLLLQHELSAISYDNRKTIIPCAGAIRILGT